MLDNTYQIKSVKGHYEAFNSIGQFVLSGDTEEEIITDLSQLIISQTKQILNVS